MTAAVAAAASAEGADLAEARRFLEALAPGEQVTFQTLDDGKEPKRTALIRILHGTLDQHATKLSALNQRGAGIFAMVNQGDGITHAGEKSCRTEKSVIRVRALFVDLDGAPLEPVLQCGVTPHIVIDSSPGRWHAYWRVSDCTLQDFKRLQHALAVKFSGDLSVNDLPRVMRLPAFYHCKGEPVLTTVRSIDGRAPYSVDEVIQRLRLDLAPVSQIKLPTPSPAQSPNAPAALGHEGKRINWEFEVRHIYPPANADLIAESCAQLREMRDTRGKIKYQIWYDCLGVLAHTVNGDDVSHDWSAGHAKYTRDETALKLAGFRAGEIRPTRCDTFESHNPKDCAGCAHRGKITSPILLGNVHRIAPQVLQPGESPSSVSVVPQSQSAGSALTAPYGAQPAAPPFGAPAATVEPLFDIESARASRFFRSSPPPRTWILKDCLPAGIVGGIVASGGTGKSQAMLQLAASVAAGLPFCDTWEVGEPGEVLALMAEDDDAELHRRMLHIARELERVNPGRNVKSAVGQNCVIKSLVGGNNLLTKLYPDREVRQTDLVARVIATAGQLSNPKLIILDPASRFRGGVENSAEDVTRFIEALECIRAAFPSATVLVVHHTNKWSSQADEQSAGAARGSSAFSDNLRFQLNLAALNKSEAARVPAGERHMYLSVTVTKNNYAPPQPTVYLKRGEGGVLTKTSLNNVGGKNDGNLQLQILARVRDIARDGEPLSAEQFQKEFGGKTNVFSVGVMALRGVIRQALDAGLLSSVATGRKKPLSVTDDGLAVLAVWEATRTPGTRPAPPDNMPPNSANSTK